MKKINQYSLLSSLLLHLIAFSSLWLYFDFSSPAITSDEQEIPYIRSYLYTNNPTLKIQQTKQSLNTPSTEHTPLTTNKNHTTTNNSLNITTPPPAPSQTTNTKTPNPLLTLLHRTIQSKQQYPPSALQMKRQGRANVSFKLYPDGTISNLQLKKSSGTASLDQAATQAVRLAAPFHEINQYLQAPEDFTIDVVFALSDEND